ncbi:MAG: 5'-deoxynucleotidase [Clostridia bacterium]|nr:5'-deoxynucleotidase [Clostridia bacterium]
MNNGDFYSLLFRMKYINRWGLMKNSRNENLMEHSMEVALISHALALIGNTKLKKSHDAEHIAAAALFHDMNEILTGDLPTPVKYSNEALRKAYKDIEDRSKERILSLLDEDMLAEYEKTLTVTDEEKKLIKAADRLCAYIKCLDELKNSNPDFASAERSIKSDLEAFDCEELKIFMADYLGSFEKTLDQITL